MKLKTILNKKKFRIILKYKSLTFYGEYIDIILENKLYDINFLPKLLNKYDLNTIITNSVGSFFVIEKKLRTYKIYNSFGNTSLFLKIEKNNFVLTDNEKKIIITNKFLNYKNYFFFIKSHRHIGLNPFNDITFNNKRIPNGYSCLIKNKNVIFNKILENNKFFYSQKKNVYEELLTKILKIYKKRYKNLQLGISGGIDSAVLFLILSKNKTKFSSYFSMDNNKVIPGAISYLMIKYLCKKYKKALILRKNKFKNLKTVKKELSNYYSFHFKKDQINKNLFPLKKTYIIGQNLDTLYYNDTFAPSTYIINLKRIVLILKTLHLRFISTYLFYKIMNFIYSFSSKKELSRVLLKRIERISSSTKEHEPFFFNSSNYTKYNRSENFLKPIIKNLKLNNKYKYKTNEISQLVKDIKWLRFVINTKLLYANYENYFNVKILTPYSEGPMVNFFYNYKLKFKEIFFVKDLQNYVIKKHENRSFWTLQILLKTKYKLANFLKNKQKNVKKKQSKLKIEKYADFKKIKFNSKKIQSIKSKLSNFCKNEDELLRLNNLLVYLDNK